MGTEYSISIRRKADKKELGKLSCNMLKTIFDTSYSKMINCGGRISADKHEFTYNELSNIVVSTENDIDNTYFKIIEKKLLIALATNTDVKNEIENDIEYLKEQVQDILNVHYAAAHICGSIATVVENLYRNPKTFDEVSFAESNIFNIPAYEYNMEDLDLEDKGNMSIWVEDVYCVIEAC